MSPFQPCPLPAKDPVNCADLALPPGMFLTSHLAPVAKLLLQVQTMLCVQLPISCPCDIKLPFASRGCFMLDGTLDPCGLSPNPQARLLNPATKTVHWELQILPKSWASPAQEGSLTHLVPLLLFHLLSSKLLNLIPNHVPWASVSTHSYPLSPLFPE